MGKGEGRKQGDGEQLYGPQQQFANFARKVVSTALAAVCPFGAQSLLHTDVFTPSIFLLAFYAFLSLSLSFLNQPGLSK